jgi:uncharacterized protein YqgC (DUF456 family)
MSEFLAVFTDGSIWQMIGVIAALLFVVIGLLGTLLPFLPGTPMIFAGALLYGLSTGFGNVNARTLIALGVMAALSSILQYLASSYGAKKLGSTNWGVFGAFLGMILAVIIPTPLGLFNLVVFPFVFAFIFELVATSSVKKSLKAGLGGMIGVFGGIFMQLMIGLAMTVILFIAIL